MKNAATASQGTAAVSEPWREALRLFDADLRREFSRTVPANGPGSMVVMARATSRSGQTQTESLIHNPAGYHHNVIQRLYVEVV